ncbi:unnamed protein product [Eruca vesicaria subsp. sativa]|uniref:Uncharacterized protein n=1 Tax=Eruca vesicaria subsp. sativa TaxID=29727 RepID=A0ABC8LRW9_ERUVS|nr:unnamed protein product [Eruca vesicaria subsp. sativa]
MLDTLIGGYGQHGFGHKDHISSGYGFEGRSEFVSHEDSGRGHFDRQSRYEHQMTLPANHGRPSMPRMPGCEDDSDDDGFERRSHSHHTTVMSQHQQKPHMNFGPSPPLASPNHNGKMGNGWQGGHGDGYHGGHGMQQHGGHGMQPHGGHGMQQHGGHGMQQHGGHGMQQHGGHGMQQHGGHGMQHHDGHGMQHHDGHGMQQHGAHGMQHHDVHGMQQHGAHGMKHQDRLMGPQISPHHVYMNPNHGSGSGRAVVVKASENWRMSKSSGGHQKVGWGSKGL